MKFDSLRNNDPRSNRHTTGRNPISHQQGCRPPPQEEPTASDAIKPIRDVHTLTLHRTAVCLTRQDPTMSCDQEVPNFGLALYHHMNRYCPPFDSATGHASYDFWRENLMPTYIEPEHIPGVWYCTAFPKCARRFCDDEYIYLPRYKNDPTPWCEPHEGGAEWWPRTKLPEQIHITYNPHVGGTWADIRLQPQRPYQQPKPPPHQETEEVFTAASWPFHRIQEHQPNEQESP